ncbi:MAG: hypothetical protein IPK66_15655 [Rhodospirillales bacterium]|nr:hypothetical protein [Rhodospirillales bacterium]
MKEVELILCLFPGNELTIRRLHARDETFRAVCGDLGEALRALRYWESTGPAAEIRAKQYRELVGELESEIANFLKAFERSAPGGG